MINALDTPLFRTKFSRGDCQISMVNNLCTKRINGCSVVKVYTILVLQVKVFLLYSCYCNFLSEWPTDFWLSLISFTLKRVLK